MKARTVNTLCLNVAATLGLACSGCSFLFTRGPDVEPAKITAETVVECSTSKVPPVLDLVLTGTHLGSAAISGLVLDDTTFGGSTGQVAVVAADIGLAALFAGSALYGFATTDSCHKAQARAKEVAAKHPANPLDPKQRPGPRVAAGFRFGMSQDAAEHVCTGTGRSFRSGDGFYACDGAPPGFAQANSVQLKLDQRGLSSIDVVIPANALWQSTFDQLRKGLIDRYGDPVRSEDAVPKHCISEAEAAACAERGEMKVSAEWKWSDGSRLVLRIPSAPGPLTIRLLYIRP